MIFEDRIPMELLPLPLSDMVQYYAVSGRGKNEISSCIVLFGITTLYGPKYRTTEIDVSKREIQRTAWEDLR